MNEFKIIPDYSLETVPINTIYPELVGLKDAIGNNFLHSDVLEHPTDSTKKLLLLAKYDNLHTALGEAPLLYFPPNQGYPNNIYINKYTIPTDKVISVMQSIKDVFIKRGYSTELPNSTLPYYKPHTGLWNYRINFDVTSEDWLNLFESTTNNNEVGFTSVLLSDTIKFKIVQTTASLLPKQQNIVVDRPFLFYHPSVNIKGKMLASDNISNRISYENMQNSPNTYEIIQNNTSLENINIYKKLNY